MLNKILAYRRHCTIGRCLVQFIAQSGFEHAIKLKERSLLRKTTMRIDRKEIVEIGLCRNVILVIIIAQSPVETHGIVTFRSGSGHGH